MRSSFSHLEGYRIKDVPGYVSPAGAHYGAFRIPIARSDDFFIAIADDGCNPQWPTNWEHVSVRVIVDALLSLSRIPLWSEMDRVKGLFWEDDETVMQFHVHGKAKVNVHPCVLHLWRPVDGQFPVPDVRMV